MPLMNAVQVAEPGADLAMVQREIPEPGEREVLIKVEACGVCHGDAIARHGRFPGIAYPRVPGHEVVGVVAKRGRSVTGWETGARVGVGWSGGYCMTCDACAEGDHQNCQDSLITGLSVDGGYAEYMVARASALVSIPTDLSSVDAAPLLCAGATTFSALKHGGAAGGETVAIHGIGGLGHLAIQFARVFGAEVTAFSTSPAKEEEALALGAHHFVNSLESKAIKEVAGTLDFVLSTINADQDWAIYLQTLRPTGTLCYVGIPPSPVSVNTFALISGLRSISGSPTGSPHQLKEMLDVAARHGVKAKTELFPMAQANAAIDKVKKNKVRYRAVLAN